MFASAQAFRQSRWLQLANALRAPRSPTPPALCSWRMSFRETPRPVGHGAPVAAGGGREMTSFERSQAMRSASWSLAGPDSAGQARFETATVRHP